MAFRVVSVAGTPARRLLYCVQSLRSDRCVRSADPQAVDALRSLRFIAGAA
jgi:hypothetical protein